MRALPPKPSEPVSDHSDTCDKAKKPTGFALVVVLWVTAFLGLLALAVTRSVRTETALVTTAEHQVRSDYEARAILNTTLLQLLEPGREIPLDGSGYRVQWEERTTTVSLEHEAGKININHADAEVIGQVLKGLGLSPLRADMLAARIVDWRDPDDRPLPSGAEAQDYAVAGVTTRPANRSFIAIEEVEQVWGLDRATARTLARVFTTRGGRTVSLRHAPAMVRSVLDQLTARERGNLIQPERPAGSGQAVSGPLTIRIPIDRDGRPPLLFQAQVVLTPGLERPFYLVDWRRIPSAG